MNNIFFVKHKSKEIVNQSSSGGVFSLLANYVIEKNGIIFGATFDKDFNVEITYTENDYSKMLGSKYVKSAIKTSFVDCKNFLDSGRLVLFTGTPCQIIGLKAFLKKEYENLITMDILCHGSPIAEIWQWYLKTFKKEIESINFRDKKESWENFYLTIKFKDGTVFSESYKTNRYYQLFLQNKILSSQCYDCKNCVNSKADVTTGDAWSKDFKNSAFHDHRGTSVVIIRSTKAENIFNELSDKIYMEKTDEHALLKGNGGYRHDFKKPADADEIRKRILTEKIAIVTDQVHKNVGGILQAVCLYDKIKELKPKAEIYFVNQKHNNHLSYFDKNVKWVTSSADSSYSHLLVGSDQIWNKKYCQGVPFEDKYLIRNIRNKIVYAASFGHHEFLYNENEIQRIHKSLKDVKFISTREISGRLLTNKWFGVDSVSVLDPTLLWDKTYYLAKINENETEQKTGIFAYVLDKNPIWEKKIKDIQAKTGEKVLPFDGSVENFLHNFNTAKFIITDSYHGSIFSIIFNKPFVCLRNKRRGNDRFDDLCLRFDIEERFIESLDCLKLDLLKNEPNVNLTHERMNSLEFLNKAFNT